MWKYIIISSVVFLGASFYYFSKNHEGMTLAPGGEIDAIYKRSASLIDEKIDAKQKEMTTAYYVEREKKYKEWAEQAEKDQTAAEQKAAEQKAEGDDLKRENDDLKEQTETVERNLKDVVSKTAAVVGLDANSSEASEIIAAAKTLMDENLALEDQIKTEKETVERLDAESKRLNGLIDAAQKLAKDRQNRISKPDLNCQVDYVDADYNFVRLNAGIDNGGVVIGSELAVMRNGKQICVLKVTNAESKSSIAELKKGSMLKGERIKVGDTVKSIRNDK